MLKYALKTNPENSAKAYGRSANISTKNAAILCSAIRGMHIEKGEALLTALLEQKQTLNHKYYTKTAKELLTLLKSARSNAEFKGLDTERLIIHASAHQAFRFYRPRGWKHRREKKKLTNVQIVLVEK